MSVGREIGDAVARADSKSLQDGRPTIASIEKLRVGPARLTIDDGDAVPDKVCARAERIREASTVFPLVEKYHEPGALVCGRAPILSTNNAGRLHSHAARAELVVGIATTGWQRRGRAATMRNDNCGTANYHSRDSVVHVVDGRGIANHLCGSACGKGGGRERS